MYFRYFIKIKDFFIISEIKKVIYIYLKSYYYYCMVYDILLYILYL